jgi:SAM-dependent methyltransferase
MTASRRRIPQIHNVHPFPARMAASIPWQLLSSERRNLRILDPMAGSGTSLVVARTMGHRAIGFDSDPLAVLLSSVWCSDISPLPMLAAAHRVIVRAASMAHMPARDAYPLGADSETKSFVRYWFDLRSRRQLAALSAAITRIRDSNIRSVLWCALSRLIITKEAGASLALDVSHSRPHRHFTVAPIQPIQAYLRAVRRILETAPFRDRRGLCQARIERGDVRRLPLDNGSVDMVITSPPYLNAIDYLRGHKLSLVWMGHTISEIRELRAGTIGTEAAGGFLADEKIRRVAASIGNTNNLPLRFQRILHRYIADMDQAIKEIARVLTPGGHALIVIGDCNVRGVYIRNSRVLEILAHTHGLTLEHQSRRTIPDCHRYLPPPRMGSGKKLQQRLRKELVLTFCR